MVCEERSSYPFGHGLYLHHITYLIISYLKLYKHNPSNSILSLFSCNRRFSISCENIRFSSLFAAGDVSRGGTSATQRERFHTDDVKYVQNPVRSPDWSTEQLHCFSYCLQMTDKRQKATKVKCKRDESLTKQSIFVEYSLLYSKHLSFAGARSQMNTHFTKIDQQRPKIE